jgi:hypothetical protein
MIEVIAKRNNGFDNSFEEITIKIDGQEVTLNRENSQNLVDVLQGKQGLIFHRKKGEYQSHKVTLFSCAKPLKLHSCEEENS